MSIVVWVDPIPISGYRSRMQTISDKHFKGDTIRIDGKYFMRCTFSEGAALVFGATGTFGFVNCKLDATTQITFDQNATMMLAGLSLLYGSGLQSVVEQLFERIRHMSKTLPGSGGEPN